MKNILKPLKAVYSYYLPETREIISNITRKYPHNIFLKSTTSGLDDFHFGIIKAYKEYFKNDVIGFEKFKYIYPTIGSSEGIFHLLSYIATHRQKIPIYVFEGEYEGYAGYGNNLGLSFEKINQNIDFKKIKKGIFFISNPSAINGNIIPNKIIKKINDAGHEIAYDGTYFGMTKVHKFILNYPSIKWLFVSFSKPFGLYYYRLGLCFSTEELKTLAPNKWFKNIFSLIIAENILKKIKKNYLYTKYEKFQKQAILLFQKQYFIKPKKSDVFLLSYLEEKDMSSELKEKFKEYKRGKYYRFCLTNYFRKIEKQSY
ncbi:hypothetical protein KAZ01_00285 [Candidatus Gracilibacteria bacterium]|nr:hypothetical protein [Candidatus Gracilibacteria bacterium]